MNDNSKKVILDRMKAKLKAGQFVLGATTGIWGSSAGFQFLEGYPPWLTFLGGFIAGFSAYMVLDDSLDLYVVIAIKQWGESVETTAKRKLAITSSVFVGVLLLISSTLTYLSNTITSQAIVGENDITIEKLEGSFSKIDNQIAALKKQSDNSLKEAKAQKKVIENRYDKKIDEAYKAGGKDFYKLYKNGNEWIFTTDVKRYNIAIRNANKIKKAKTKALDKYHADIALKVKEISKEKINYTKKGEEKTATILGLAKDKTDRHKARSSTMFIGITVIEGFALFFVIFSIFNIIVFCRNEDIEFGEAPIGLDGILKIAINRLFGFIQIKALSVLGRVDVSLKNMSKQAGFASTVQNPSIGGYLVDTALSKQNKMLVSAPATIERNTPTQYRQSVDNVDLSDKNSITGRATPTLPSQKARNTVRDSDTDNTDSRSTTTATVTTDSFIKVATNKLEVPFKNLLENREERKQIMITAYEANDGQLFVKNKTGDKYLSRDKFRKDVNNYYKRANEASRSEDSRNNNKDNYYYYVAAIQLIDITKSK